ncbi:MAG: ORF6N domain-containing protein [Dehalococcoidia bacterium]|nr:MAG: ORF6N domain-containing protein [Dehalococcoidia bacterium]
MQDTLISEQTIGQKIYLIRGQKIMLDRDLARLYEVSTGRLNEQVKRNKKRFPEDFAFLLTRQAIMILKSQIATSRWGGSRKLPYAFTEQGVAMLSGVLNSERAILVNIAIMRTFVKLRHILSSNKALALKLEQLERNIEKHDTEIHAIFEAIRRLMAPPVKPKRSIGFHVN